jgi:beta-glucosidase-like glycosyl hydrolase
MEVPSEDPLLLGDYGAQYSLGLQHSPADGRYLQAVTTLKHPFAYSLVRSRKRAMQGK